MINDTKLNCYIAHDSYEGHDIWLKLLLLPNNIYKRKVSSVRRKMVSPPTLVG